MLRRHTGTGKDTKLISIVQETDEIAGGPRVAVNMACRGYDLDGLQLV